LRIIAGEHKGRKLASVPGSGIRPTADRIRESVFNIIGLHTADAVVLDLFAGTGALGLEALSRGAAIACFVDNSPRALSVVEKSIGMMDLGERARTIRWDITRNLDCLRTIGLIDTGRSSTIHDRPGESGFNLVFIDPPYDRNLIGKTLTHLSRGDVLAKDAVIVVEHSRSEPIPEDTPGYGVADRRDYGRTHVSFLSVAI
jgi:16S rRNA (guanine966-N2)-methyltransferase